MLRILALFAVALVAVGARELPYVVCSLPACTNLEKLGNDARGIWFHRCPDDGVPQTRLAAAEIAPDSPIAQQIWDTHPTPDAYWIGQYLESLGSCNSAVRIECWPKAFRGCARPGAPLLPPLPMPPLGPPQLPPLPLPPHGIPQLPPPPMPPHGLPPLPPLPVPPHGPPPLPMPPNLPPLPFTPPHRMVKLVKTPDPTFDDNLVLLP